MLFSRVTLGVIISREVRGLTLFESEARETEMLIADVMRECATEHKVLQSIKSEGRAGMRVEQVLKSMLSRSRNCSDCAVTYEYKQRGGLRASLASDSDLENSSATEQTV